MFPTIPGEQYDSLGFHALERYQGEKRRTLENRKILGVCRTWGIEHEKAAERGQIVTIFPVQSGTMGQERGEIWTTEIRLQPIHPKSNRLLDRALAFGQWQLQELLFAWCDDPPETLSRSRQRILILYTWAIWVYRAGMFLGIAILVYSYFLRWWWCRMCLNL